MFLHIDVSLDQASSQDRGAVIRRWFEDISSVLFTPWEDNADVDWSAGVMRGSEDDMMHFEDRDDQRAVFLAELEDGPFWATASLRTADEETLTTILTSPPIYDDARFLSLSANLFCSEEEAGDEDFCSRIALSVAVASAELNPAFGRVELEWMDVRSNLDVGLRRRPSASMPDSRNTLRGYAWVTVIPEEIFRRLGGLGDLEATGAFFRVRPLPGGGALLQASPSIAGYTEAVMEGVFTALAPALPPGSPSAHVAFPDVRFVSRDASELKG